MVGSAAGQNTASAELAVQMTDFSVQEIDWAKSVASGNCKAILNCNGPGRTDGVKGRKDLSNKVCDSAGAKLAVAYRGWSVGELTKFQRAFSCGGGGGGGGGRKRKRRN